MKVLVDNATSWNLGDMAMLESAVMEFLRVVPDAELHLIDRPKPKTSVWGLPRVQRAADLQIAGDWLSALDRRLIWRFSKSYQSTLLRVLISSVGRWMHASGLPVSTGLPGALGYTTLGRFCEQYGALYLSGGGYLTDTFPGEMLRKCALILSFSEQGKPVTLTGQQIGPFRGKAARGLVMRALAKCSFVGLREPTDSVRYCELAGLKAGRFAEMGDDSFALSPADPCEINRLLAKYGVQRGRFIAVNLRTDWYARDTRRHLPKVAELVRALVEGFGMPVLVVPIALKGKETDIENGEQLAAMAGHEGIKVMQADGLMPATVRGVLGCAWGGIGVSYHFCTFSLTEGIPAICLYADPYYKQKAQGIAAFWGDERLSLSLSEMQVGPAMSHIRQVFEDTKLRAALVQRTQDAQRTWHEIFRRAVSGWSS